MPGGKNKHWKMKGIKGSHINKPLAGMLICSSSAPTHYVLPPYKTRFLFFCMSF